MTIRGCMDVKVKTNLETMRSRLSFNVKERWSFSAGAAVAAADDDDDAVASGFAEEVYPFGAPLTLLRDLVTRVDLLVFAAPFALWPLDTLEGDEGVLLSATLNVPFVMASKLRGVGGDRDFHISAMVRRFRMSLSKI
jgi:hypothetical protein